MPRTFLYFLPDRHTLTVKDAASAAIAYAFERSIDCAQVPGGGPGGQAGIVCAEAGSYAPGQLRYDPAQQTWLKIPERMKDEGGRMNRDHPSSLIPHPSPWVGHYRDAPPGPADLARSEQLAGHRLALADDHEWLVPLARSFVPVGEGAAAELRYRVQLPQRLELAADGLWTAGGVLSKFATLWELAQEYLAVWSGTATPEQLARFDDQTLTNGAVLALQANYRLGLAECSLLGLLTDANTIDILDRLIDLPTWHDFHKKKRTLAQASPDWPAGSNSPAGPAAEIPATGPPAPT